MKKVLALLLACLMIFSFISCARQPGAGEGDPYKAALLINGTLGDKSFFDSANDGLERLRDELGKDVFDFEIEQMGGEAANQPKWTSTLLDFCDTGEYDVIIIGTWQMYEGLAEASVQFPDQKFIFFDETFDFSKGDFNNIYNVLYKQNEVSFLVGAAAAMMTTDERLPMVDPETKAIGFLGGMNNPIISDFLLGYIQGAKHVEPDIKVVIGYVGDFIDSAKGKDIALTQYQMGGVDVGFNVAARAGLGQIEAAEVAKRYVFGVDSDQAALLPEQADYIPTSALKNVGNSLIRAIKLDMEGSLAYGSAESLGFAEGGVNLVKDAHYEEMLPEDIREKINELEKDIIDGKIVVDTALGKTTEEIEAIKESVQ